jgi:hypothetical protein
MTAGMSNVQGIETVSPIIAEERQVSEATRVAYYCMLDELPGLIFGALTIGYIVVSLAHLAP